MIPNETGDTPREPCNLCGGHPNTPVSHWGTTRDRTQVFMAVCEECREYFKTVMDWGQTDLVEFVQHVDALQKLRQRKPPPGPQIKLMPQPLPEAVQFALDQVNRLCGGGAYVTADGQIVCPRTRGVVVFANGEVSGGQDAYAIASAYDLHNSQTADAMVTAEWEPSTKERTNRT